MGSTSNQKVCHIPHQHHPKSPNSTHRPVRHPHRHYPQCYLSMVQYHQSNNCPLSSNSNKSMRNNCNLLLIIVILLPMMPYKEWTRNLREALCRIIVGNLGIVGKFPFSITSLLYSTGCYSPLLKLSILSYLEELKDSTPVLIYDF